MHILKTRLATCGDCLDIGRFVVDREENCPIYECRFSGAKVTTADLACSRFSPGQHVTYDETVNQRPTVNYTVDTEDPEYVERPDFVAVIIHRFRESDTIGVTPLATARFPKYGVTARTKGYMIIQAGAEPRYPDEHVLSGKNLEEIMDIKQAEGWSVERSGSKIICTREDE